MIDITTLSILISIILGFVGAYALLWSIRQQIISNCIELEKLKTEFKLCPYHLTKKEID